MEKVDLTDLYTQRLLVFLESGPQSNKYRQMILGPEEFRRVSDVLMEVMEATGKTVEVGGRLVEIRNYKLSDETYKLPDTLRDITYPKIK